MLYMDCNRGAIINIDQSNVFTTYTSLPTWPSPGWCGHSSAGGATVMLMLLPETAYAPQLVTFGGVNDSGKNCNSRGNGAENKQESIEA
jgi:hypothetical protein